MAKIVPLALTAAFAAWLREHLPGVLSHFGVEDAVGWQVRGMFVVDEPLFATHLRDIGMEVRSLESLHANADI
jgi:hypothetical protein